MSSFPPSLQFSAPFEPLIEGLYLYGLDHTTDLRPALTNPNDSAIAPPSATAGPPLSIDSVFTTALDPRLLAELTATEARFPYDFLKVDSAYPLQRRLSAAGTLDSLPPSPSPPLTGPFRSAASKAPAAQLTTSPPNQRPRLSLSRPSLVLTSGNSTATLPASRRVSRVPSFGAVHKALRRTCISSEVIDNLKLFGFPGEHSLFSFLRCSLHSHDLICSGLLTTVFLFIYFIRRTQNTP